MQSASIRTLCVSQRRSSLLLLSLASMDLECSSLQTDTEVAEWISLKRVALDSTADEEQSPHFTDSSNESKPEPTSYYF